MNDDTITIASFNWDETNDLPGITAQEIGPFVTMQSSINGPSGSSSQISTTAGSNGSSASGYIVGSINGVSNITISDPWEEYDERITRLEKLLAEETEVRKNHPAVQRAYDEYRLLLVLAGMADSSILTEK
jgi:hypothetical protein